MGIIIIFEFGVSLISAKVNGEAIEDAHYQHPSKDNKAIGVAIAPVLLHKRNHSYVLDDRTFIRSSLPMEKPVFVTKYTRLPTAFPSIFTF